MMSNKSDNELCQNDMVQFKEDRYTWTLGIIQKITETGHLWIRICGGGGIGHRLVSPDNCTKVEALNEYNQST